MILFSYLAISAALASEADFIFIPEEPVAVNWPDKLCKKILQVRVQFQFGKHHFYY